MPYWTRITVLERLVQLIEDIERVGDRALALDTASGGSVDLPVGEFGSWKAFYAALVGAEQTPASFRDRLRVIASRLPHGDDSDLAEAQQTLLLLYTALHAAYPAVIPWLANSGQVLAAALGLQIRLREAEDEANRVLTAVQDLRRNLRRAR